MNQKTFAETGISAEFELIGEKALFTDPISKLGGEKMSYPVPTYGALKGIAERLYYKPSFMWIIEKVRVMNEVKFHSEGVRLPHVNQPGADLADWLYLVDVRYQVRGRLVWNLNRNDLEQDRDARKHEEILARALRGGGRLPAYFGIRECAAEIRPCKFGDGDGFYDNAPSYPLGVMSHSVTWPHDGYDDASRSGLMTHQWVPQMRNGVIEFPPPWECAFRKSLDVMRKGGNGYDVAQPR